MMKPEYMFQESDSVKGNGSEQDILSQYSEEFDGGVLESKEKMQQWTKQDYLQSQQEIDHINNDLRDAIETGLTPDNPQIQNIIRRHYEWMRRYYTPTADVYSGLGDIYVGQPDYKQLFNSYHPRLAEFLRDGMKIFAERELK